MNTKRSQGRFAGLFATLRQPRSVLARMVWSIAACALVTLLSWPLRDTLDPANIAMLYLLAVALIAAYAGSRAAITAAFFSTALLDFFFIQPMFSFKVGDVQYVVTLAVMLVVALIIGNLTIGLQRQTTAAVKRERQSQALYQLASQLAGAMSLEQVAKATRNFLHQTQSCRSALLIRRNNALHPVGQEHLLDSELQSAAAFAAMQQAQTRSLLEETRHWLFLPLPGSTYVRGVLALDFGGTAPATICAQQALYEAIASLVAISVERLHFVEVAQRAQLQMTDERLRSAILSALSHDIRTPLTVLYGMADTLSLAHLPPVTRDMVSTMREQILRLNSMVSNLLDMAKLRAGSIRLNQEWQPVEEVIGASIKLLGTALAQHPVKVILPPDLPLLKFDAVLMERVLCNLLENAAKYAPPSSLITISAQIEGGNASISVRDTDPGFPPDKLDKVFDLFERGDSESNVPGVGLGLAICRSIVEAHGGEIRASNCDGACVTFTVPLGEPPSIATVIASQATISGTYSMTLQAMRMGYLPRLFIRHTSDSQRGQIYIPAVNWMMLIGVVILVLEFGSSGALAAAYGIAVSGTMIITTLLTVFITLMLPGRARLPLLAALAVFALLELMFFGSNLTKFASGGWMPLALGLFLFLLLSTWKRGSTLIAGQRRKLDIPMSSFISGPQIDATRVPGTAAYLTADPAFVPSALFHNLKHFKVLHEQTLFLHVVTADVPYIEPEQRLRVTQLAPGMYNVALHFGFREEVDIPLALLGLGAHGVEIDSMSTTFFIARSNVVDGPGGMARWRCALFSWMTRQSEGAASFFNLPANQVVELGTKVVL